MSERFSKLSSWSRIDAEIFKMMMPQSSIADEIRLAAWTTGIKESALQRMLMQASGPEFTSFALGLPAMEFFPSEEYAAAAVRVLGKTSALQYGPPCSELKRHVVQLMARRGVTCTEDEVFLTSGAQQGMNLLAHLLVDPEAEILMEEMAYPGFQQVIEPFCPRILTVGTELETGMDVEAVAAALAAGHRPAFIYAVTDGHNPLGVSMSVAKRARLTSLAREYCVPILEDDAYGFINYDDHPVPPMRAFNDEWVLYVGSFSKILSPALRVGWLIVPASLQPQLAIVKEASDINTATLAQHTIAEFLNLFELSDHLTRVCHEYRARRDAVLRILEEEFPAGTEWCVPISGMFVWVNLPAGLSSAHLLKLAIAEKLVFIPGEAFYVGQEPYAGNGLRLNFSNCNVSRIQNGLVRLAQLARQLAHSR